MKECLGSGGKMWMWNLMSLIISCKGRNEEALTCCLFGCQQFSFSKSNPSLLHSYLT
jgi:hypothetical protein